MKTCSVNAALFTMYSTRNIALVQFDFLPPRFPSPLKLEHKNSTGWVVESFPSLQLCIIYHFASVLDNKISFAKGTFCK